MKLKFLNIALSICLSTIVGCLGSCSTGIESTKTIKLSKNDRKEVRTTEEEKLISAISPDIITNWHKGKQFLVTDNKISLLLEVALPSSYSSTYDNLAGRVLTYSGYETYTDAGGSNLLAIKFNDEDILYHYKTGKNSSEILGRLGALDIPFLIDLELVSKADSLLKDKILWTKTSLWYDESGNIVKGKKFVPVRIDKVRSGDFRFPFIIDFTDEYGQSASLYMNIKSATGIGSESRTFPSLFYIDDPKTVHQSISAETWECIQNGNLKRGMTKEECKLALGNPTDINSGHTWDKAIDIWTYKDGSYMKFEDGLLVDYRY